MLNLLWLVDLKHNYGEFSSNQIINTKNRLRKDIFYILVSSDPKTDENIDIKEALKILLHKIGGLNSILNYPDEIVWILSLLEKARLIYPDNGFSENEFHDSEFRKLILDAGAEVLKIKEV